jgi:hypothetical protein
MGAKRNAYKILVGKYEGTKQLGISRRKITRMGLREWESVDWIHLAQDRNQWQAHVKMTINL